jgi:translation initiation factor 1 (eIF-1/SUI1)
VAKQGEFKDYDRSFAVAEETPLGRMAEDYVRRKEAVKQHKEEMESLEQGIIIEMRKTGMGAMICVVDGFRKKFEIKPSGDKLGVSKA